MPDWSNYFTGYAAGTSTSDGWVNISVPSVSQVQQDYEVYIRERERQDRVMEQMLQEQAELEEEKRKYPLFFLKEGIV